MDLPLPADTIVPPLAQEKPCAAFLGDRELIENVYGQARIRRLRELAHFPAEIIDPVDLEESLPADTEIIFSTWSMPEMTPEQLDRLPKLKAVFYAAGTVQRFARPFLERGILVVSAWQANALPVAEFTLAQILLSTKGYFTNLRSFNGPEYKQNVFHGFGNYGETIALLGVGAIGRRVIELLKPFHLHVLAFDPFLSESAAAVLGVEKVSLENAFSRGYVISNHIANLPETVGMLNAGLFERMRPHATFINTGRGATVNEDDLIPFLRKRSDVTALLDVTHPEPPEKGSPLYSMPNVFLTPHIAGSFGHEVQRLADYCIEEFESWLHDRPLRYSVTKEMLERMA